MAQFDGEEVINRRTYDVRVTTFLITQVSIFGVTVKTRDDYVSVALPVAPREGTVGGWNKQHRRIGPIRLTIMVASPAAPPGIPAADTAPNEVEVAVEQMWASRHAARLSMPFPVRLPLASSLAFVAGAGLGLSHGATEAGLRFRAENAHRFPTSYAYFQFLTRVSRHWLMDIIGLIGRWAGTCTTSPRITIWPWVAYERPSAWA